jgi:hypothetical protein
MKTSILGWLAAIVLAAGCGATVRSKTAATANLAQYHTFAFYTSPYKKGQPETIADQAIRSAITQDLEQRGLTKATTGRPEILIAYHRIEQQKLDVTDVGYDFGEWGGVPDGWGSAPDVTTYTQGTLVVDLIDPTTMKAVWRGTASEVVNHPNNPNVAKLDKAINKLMSQYPAQVAAAPRQPM